MKLFLVLVLGLVAYANAGDAFSAEFKEKLMTKVQEVGAKCAEQEKASGDDIGELMNKKTPTRKEGKCLVACFNQAFGAQDASGKFSKEGSITALEPFKKENEEIYNKMLGVMDVCLPEVKSSDRCEAAAEMAACFNGKAEAAGLTPDLIM